MSTSKHGTREQMSTTRTRALASVVLAACAALSLVCQQSTPQERPDSETPFSLTEWQFHEIPVAGNASGSESYRLRLDVMYDRTTATPGGESSPEMRVLLQHRGDSEFDCLRWREGTLELITFRGGQRLSVGGTTAAALPLLSLLENAAEPVSLRFVIDRSPYTWSVEFLGEQVIMAPVAPLASPSVLDTDAGDRPARFKWASTPEWNLVGRSLQPLTDIVFDDAFDRTNFLEGNEYRQWGGEWKLDATRDTSRAMNAFRLRGRITAADSIALTTVGHDFWRDYRLTASIKFPTRDTSASGGLVFAARPPGRLGLVRWRCLPANEPAARGKDRFGRALLEVVDATLMEATEWDSSPPAYAENVILALPWRPRPDQWYRVSVALFDEIGEISINDMHATFPLPGHLRSGECGLFSASTSGVLFDDVSVRAHGEFRYSPDSLVGPRSLGEGLAELARVGDGDAWIAFTLPRTRRLPEISWRDTRGETCSVLVDPALSRGRVMRTSGAGKPQVLARFTVPENSPSSEYVLQLRSDSCAVQTRDGVELAHAALPATRSSTPVIACMDIRGNLAMRSLAGGALEPLGLVTRRSHAFGKVDVRLNDKGQVHDPARWQGFTAWIDDKGAWDIVGGSAFLRAPLWGDLDVSFEPTAGAVAGGKVALRLLPYDDEGKPIELVVLAEESRLAVELPGGGQLSLPRSDADRATLPVLGLSRVAGRLLATLNGSLVGESRLDGAVAVRIEARSSDADPSQLEIHSQSVDESLFTSAPVEWARWRGYTDMTDKWQCDPRWSFLGFWAKDVDTKLDAAGLFTRASYAGDTFLHFNFAFKDMLGGHVNRRRYVRRDLNFAFACESEDLTSGYCLLLGGFDNTGTQILRRGELVAESKAFSFPTFDGSNVTDLHWRWFNLEILRRKGTITAMLDRKPIIEWTDPEPLPEGHVAAWVLGGGMILGRTRFSSQGRGAPLAAFDTSTPENQPPPGWRGLDLDRAVAIDATSLGAVRVTNRFGGGPFAAEYVVPEKTPPSAFAFRSSKGSRIRAQAWYPRRPEPAGIADEAGWLPSDGAWHAFELKSDNDKPTRLVFGDLEPTDYLAVGIGGNEARDWYEVMLFPSLREAKLFALARGYVDRGAEQ